jgi:preprotein translocase subunit YajC
LNSLIAILAADAPAAPPAGAPWMQFITSFPFLLMMLLVVFYVFMIRSKRQQDRQRQDMIRSLRKGDRVQTIGGILGSVVEARDDEVVVKVDENSNTKIRFARSAINRVVESDRPPAK